jgi:hypothetical protein
MATARELLHRFRPAGAPGAASATGVPADRGADLAAELQPLFARLTVTEQECGLIVQQAQAAADQVRARAAQRARALVLAAQQRVDGERAAVAAQARQRGEEESAATLASAADQAALVRRRAVERLPAQVDAVMAGVQALIDGSGPAGPGSAPPAGPSAGPSAAPPPDPGAGAV